MVNAEIYDQVFIKSFNVKTDQLNTLRYRSISAWDSIGHMALIASLEEAFEIMFDTNDILEFGSYTNGKLLLKKYNIDL